MQAELDLGQADPRRRIARGDTVPARERELGPAAHAVSVDRRDGRAGQPCELLEHALAVFDRVLDRAALRIAREFPEIGADRKAARLARADHDASGRLEREPLDDLLELVDDRAAERVDRTCGAIECQRHDAVRVAFGAPTRKTQPLEHGPLRRKWKTMIRQAAAGVNAMVGR